MATAKAYVPGIMQRSMRHGFAVTRDEAHELAREMVLIKGVPEQMSFLDDRLSLMSEQYCLSMFLSKRPDYRVTVTAA